MKTLHLPLLALCLLSYTFLFSQSSNIQQATSVNTDGSPPSASAMLDVQSTTQGILVPRLTSAQRTAIASPAIGLLVYDTDKGTFWFYENSTWNEIPTTTPPSEYSTNGTSMSIPDCDPAGISSTIALSDPGTVTAEVQFKVCLDITHTWTGNLDISLESPDGASIDLSSDNGNNSFSDNYTSTCFTTEASSPITGGNGPFSGHWRPEEPFSTFIGKTIAGNWKLNVVDDECGDVGQLNWWSIKIAKPSSVAILLSDADSDTKVQVEDVPDEDVIRFDAGGNERLHVSNDSALFWVPVRVRGRFVSGDVSNYASSFGSFVGGGFDNTAGFSSFVGGGHDNTASGARSFVGGGVSNIVSGNSSFVGGGSFNNISGNYSFGSGGWFNNASGTYSFVGGGINLLAKSYSEAVFGSYNTNYTPVSQFVFEPVDRLFVIGNGTSGNRSNAVTVMKNGNFGLGTDTPDELLEATGNILIRNPTNNGALILSASSAGYETDPELVIQSAENGNGGSAPFHISRNAIFRTSDDTYQYIDDVGSAASKIEFNSSGDLVFSTAPAGTGAVTFTENLRIHNTSGDVGIGTSTPGEALEVNGNIFASTGDLYTSNANGVINAGGGIMIDDINIIADNTPTTNNVNGDEDLYIEGDLELGGQGYKPGGGFWAVASDMRLKQDVRPYMDGLSQLMQVRPVRYRYNDICKFPEPEREYVGIIAQDMQAIAPYMVKEEPFGQVVTEDEAGNETVTVPGTPYLTYDGTALTYMLVNAVQEQQRAIDELEMKNGELREAIVQLQTQLSELDGLKIRLAKLEAALGK